MLTMRAFIAILALAGASPCFAQQPVDATTKAAALERQLNEAVALLEDAKVPADAAPALERLVLALGERPEGKVAAQLLELCMTTRGWQGLDAATVQALLDQTLIAQQNGHTELLAAPIVALHRFAPGQPEIHSLRFELFGRATPLFNVAKAIQSLGELRDMIPNELDSWAEIARKLLGLAFIVGDVGDGIDGVRTLLSYWNGCESQLRAGQPIRAPTASDIRVFRLLPVLCRDSRIGERMTVITNLDTWAKEQPDNVAQLILLALAQSSLSGGESKDRYAPPKACALLERVLAITDPNAKVKPPQTAWTLHEVRGVLLEFGVPCGDSVDALRRYVTELRKKIQKPGNLPLLHFADYAVLSKQISSRGDKLTKRRKELAELNDLVKATEREIRAAGGRPGTTPGTFDTGSADQRDKVAGLVRKLVARNAKRDTLAKTLADEEALLMEYGSRLAEYDRARSR